MSYPKIVTAIFEYGGQGTVHPHMVTKELKHALEACHPLRGNPQFQIVGDSGTGLDAKVKQTGQGLPRVALPVRLSESGTVIDVYREFREALESIPLRFRPCVGCVPANVASYRVEAGQGLGWGY